MKTLGRTCILLSITLLTGLCLDTFAGKAPELPLTKDGEKLYSKYDQIFTTLKAELAVVVPAIDAEKKEAFIAAHQAVEDVPPQPNPAGLKAAPPRYAPSHNLYAVAQSNAVDVAAPLLNALDGFLSDDKLDAKFAKCALIAHASPRGLAEFAQLGKEEEKVIDELLNDEALILQIMKIGGAFEGKYGQAMQNYRAIRDASKRAHEGMFQRFALASCLEHPDRSVPENDMTAAELGIAPEDLEKSGVAKGRTTADVMVEMYLNYEKAFLDGILDPAFDSYPDFEYRFIFPEYEVEHATWFREMLRNYRPDHIVNPDYKWRYCAIVRTDVPYTGSVGRPVRPDLNLTRFQDFFLEGGICGPRAFVGKLSTAAFGVPTRGARQTGHAAMSHWTPEGWTTVFGAWWTWNNWRGRCGLDFFLETQARREPKEFTKVLRAQWLGDALAEEKINPMAYGVGGGLWNALAFYKKLAIVEEARIAALPPTGSELAESNEPAESPVSDWVAGKSVVPAETPVPSIKLEEKDKTIVFGEDGVITVPPGAAHSVTNSKKILFMRTIDDDGVQVHYCLGGGQPELLKYDFDLPAAGKYELVATVCTVTVDRKFMLRLNRRTMVDIDLPYTKGTWMDTKPVEVELKEGRNSLQFTAAAPNKGFSIKEFKLRPVK